MRILVFLCVVLVAVSARRMAKGGLFCSLCEGFVGGIESALKNGEGDIEGYANKLCDQLTNGNAILDPICKGLIDGELENIINWLNNDEPPEKICGYLHLC